MIHMYCIRKDIGRYYQKDKGLIWNVYNVLFSQGIWATVVYRFGNWTCSIKNPFKFFPFIIYIFSKKIVEIITGINIGTSANIGEGFYISHFGNIHINSKVKIGKYCFINNGVTIGASGIFSFADCPTIGENVYIGAGAKILGDIVIGNNVVIGANTVVTKNVPENSTIVGNPGIIVKRDGYRLETKIGRIKLK